MKVQFKDVKRGSMIVGGYVMKPGTPNFQHIPSGHVVSARNGRTGVRKITLDSGETFEVWAGGEVTVESAS